MRLGDRGLKECGLKGCGLAERGLAGCDRATKGRALRKSPQQPNKTFINPSMDQSRENLLWFCIGEQSCRFGELKIPIVTDCLL